jgi:1-deoxy-D-xylulose 5-phosphate reductoisomerase
MRIPVRQVLGLATPESRVAPLSAEQDLRELNRERFPGAALGHAALARGPAAVAALVGGDEAAVAAFVSGELTFDRIVPLLRRCVDSAPAVEIPPEQMLRAATRAREVVLGALVPAFTPPPFCA